jgi:hypothetical protein
MTRITIFNAELSTQKYITSPFNCIGWNYIVLAHWNNSSQVNMSLHSDTLFWFRNNRSLLLLLNAARLAEKQQTDITIFNAELSAQKYITSHFISIILWLILPFSMQNFLHKTILPPLLAVLDFTCVECHPR